MTPAPLPCTVPAPTSLRLSSIALLMSLAACGGGGGNSSAEISTPPAVPVAACKDSDIPVTTSTPAPAPGPAQAPSGTIVISGKAVYESVPATPTAGLNYAASVDRPIRGATVQLLDGVGSVLATTTSDEQGNYSVGMSASQAVKVRVRAEIKRTNPTIGDRDFSVLDNTNGNAIYALDSLPFTPPASTTQNLRAASGWGGSSYATTRAAAPFAILDVAYAAQAKVATVATVSLPSLKLFWSINNRPASPFNATTGAIGTSFFTTDSTGRALFILGAADTDTDEYDTHVIAHEFGHYLQSAVSRDDSVGGSHGSGDKLDARVAFSEGWGNGWSGIALGDPVYIDSYNAGQRRSFPIDVSVAATGSDRGWYSETAAQYLVWTTNQTLGFSSIYNSLTGLKTAPLLTTLYSFASALKNAASTSATAITSLWGSQNIVSQNPCGTSETNDGGLPAVLPVYQTYTAALGTAQNYCVYADLDSSDHGNRLGEFVYVRFVASGTHTLTLTKTSPSGAATTDPDFVLLESDGTTVNADSSVNDLETLTVTLPTGTHTIALTDFKLTNPRTSGTSCFDFKVN